MIVKPLKGKTLRIWYESREVCRRLLRHNSAKIGGFTKEANIERVVLTQLSGSRANQEDIFRSTTSRQWCSARPIVNFMYTEEMDIMLGRQHANLRHSQPPNQAIWFDAELVDRPCHQERRHDRT